MMKFRTKPLRTAIVSGLFAATIGMPVALTAAPCMPCAPRAGKRNPCSPCAAKNPCAAMNPCSVSARIDPKLITRPEGTQPFRGDPLALVTEGRELWNSKKISGTDSISCATCHKDGTAMLQPSFAKSYPHFVQMAFDVANKESITLEEMVQLCMVKPMQTNPFAWD